MSAPASYPIESVENAARVLLMLRSQRVLRVAEVAAELGIARSSAHRMLTTLQSQGLLRQEPATRGYGPGPQLIQIGVAVIGATDLRAEARPTLERLCQDIGETVHLISLDGATIVFLDGVEGRFAIRAALRAGDRAPAHASAAGKVLLASLSRDQLRERYPGSRIQGGTNKAISTRRMLENELETVREQGYALNLGESEAGLHAIAAPVRDATGNVRAAISISGPSERLTEEKLTGHVRTLLDAVDQLSTVLS
ncbi:IclR family transcriptional regulator [Amycolatopsis pithecellobii]|uniref:Glycerol operon regulatory protein n=1 Tax=Amycolatopsis pithecellobii TaxID=664692 RepID=A0A6N7ZBI5_9PSEU|nr:IclR family transcriptional regulator [Amycolatopsis pithecellobii]MTD59134.1 helix-turn-helix domain-containing protein [Amycolatopsis pithecellobii]